MNLEQLILKLRVEEENRKNEKTDWSSMEAKANVIEGSTSKPKFSHNHKKGKTAAKRASTAPKAVMFKKKIQGSC